MMPNVLQYPVAIAGTLRAGCVVVNVNPLYKPRELEFQLTDSGAEAIVVLENFAAVLQEALPHTQVKHVVIASMGDMLGVVKGAVVNGVVRHVKKMVPAYNLPARDHIQGCAERSAATCPSPRRRSGPTISPSCNTPAAPPASPRAPCCCTAIWSPTCCRWRPGTRRSSPCRRRRARRSSRPRCRSITCSRSPPASCSACGVGGLCLLIPNPRDIGGLIKELTKYKVNSFPAVNTLYNALLHHPDFGKIDWSMLKSAVGGGMAVQKAVADAWFKATGKPIIEGYGLSETSPVLTCNRGDIAGWTGTIGLPLPSTEISIRDDARPRSAAGRAGRNLRARTAGHARLLAAAG